MKPKVDARGYFVEDVEVREEITGVIPTTKGYVVGYPVPEGLYKPRLDIERLKREYKSDDTRKWPDGSDVELVMSFWIEGLTSEEIAELKKPILTESELIRHEMAEQNAEMWDFILSSVGGA